MNRFHGSIDDGSGAHFFQNRDRGSSGPGSGCLFHGIGHLEIQPMSYPRTDDAGRVAGIQEHANLASRVRGLSIDLAPASLGLLLHHWYSGAIHLDRMRWVSACQHRRPGSAISFDLSFAVPSRERPHRGEPRRCTQDRVRHESSDRGETSATARGRLPGTYTRAVLLRRSAATGRFVRMLTALPARRLRRRAAASPPACPKRIARSSAPRGRCRP